LQDTPSNGFTLLGEFADPGAEEAYQDAKWPQTRRRMRYVCTITALAYLAAVYMDYLVLGTGSALSLMVSGRLTAFFMGMLAAFFTLPAAGGARRLGWALCAYMFFVLLVESLEQVLKFGRIETQGVPACVIIVLTYYLFLPPRALPTLVAGIGGSLAYLLTLLLLPTPPERIVNAALFLGLVNAFGVYFLTRFGSAQRREYRTFLQLKEMAEIDPLTGIYNRRRVLELGERALRQALRYDEPFSVLLLDIDHFKAVNDRYGHGVGDLVLREVAERCKGALREVDLFGRLGGEEFVAFLHHSGLAQALTAAERVCKAVGAAAIPIGSDGARVTASIGVAELTPDAADMDELLLRADKALYQAKLAGRNRACAW
jgi:diguanylate cyclase (GGDEF)-like protein